MIRLATLKDIEMINELGKVFNENFTKTYDVKNYISNNNYIVLVNEDDYINGILLAYKNIDFLEIEGIAVSINFRRKGIADKLLKHLIANYGDKIKEIILEVAVNNNSAINLYQKNNFEIINIRKKYYNGNDAYVMKRVV